LLYGGTTQIAAQLFEVVTIAVAVFGLSYALFSVLKGVGLMRSRAEDEVAGLDLPEMGVPGYVADLPVPGGQTAPRGAQPSPSILTAATD
jgi:Amt family ammonium transporter